MAAPQLEIPGYREAVQRERLNRDAAFLNIEVDVAGFPVTPITLQKYLLLKVSGNAFLAGRAPSPVDVINFLWLLNPAYEATAHPERHCKVYRALLRRCQRFIPPEPSWLLRKRVYAHRVNLAILEAAKLTCVIRQYIDDQLQDYPARSGQADGPSYYSSAAFLCGLMGKQFGWTDEHTLNCPMPRLLQFMNYLKQSNGSNAPLFNPSDRFTGKWLSELNKNLKRN